MPLLRIELRKRLFLWPACLTLLTALAFFTRADGGLLCLYIELIYTCIPMTLSGLLYGGNDEIDLVISAPKATARCFAAKWLSIYMIASASLFTAMLAVSLVFQRPVVECLFIALSFMVTAALLMSAASFLRLILRNAFASVPVLLVLLVVAALNHDAIRKNLRPAHFIYFDPYISDFFIGTPIWFINRLIILGISAALLLASFLFLRRDKLYHAGAA